MQNVFWDKELTTTIQNDEFLRLLERIWKKSERLRRFASQEELPLLDEGVDKHLLNRSRLRQRNFHRHTLQSNAHETAADTLYDARDRSMPCQRRSNVFEATRKLYKWPLKLNTTADLAGILQNWPNIEGYDHIFDKVLLSDRLNIYSTLAVEWGALVNLRRVSRYKDRYRLMFFFGTLSFGGGIDMDIVRTLIAFAVLEDLKTVNLPNMDLIRNFITNNLRSLITSCNS